MVSFFEQVLCHVPSIGSYSQFCFILQPHRVAVPFPPTFVLPWRNSFVQIHDGTSLLKAKFGGASPCALHWLLQPVLFYSTTSSCCCTFPSNFWTMAEQFCSNPWQNIFVEGKIWDHPTKTTQESYVVCCVYDTECKLL